MRTLCVIALAILGQASSTPLRIVVLEGEGAVNIIQQKTAVRPLVEIRDRNNLPVAGATVTFTIGGGQPAAFAGGLQTLTVTTNAAGQAAATGFNVLGPGAVQIQAQAAFQGQIATAAISQTNFATAAAAAQAGAGAGAGGGASGASAGGAAGGGISGTTLGIVGAAVAGGAVAATQVTGSGNGDGGNGDSFDVYRGTFAGQMVFTSVGTGGPVSPSTCIRTRSVTGTLLIELSTDLRTGTARLNDGVLTDLSVSGNSGCTIVSNPNMFTVPGEPATGGPSALTFTSTRTFSDLTTIVRFTGAHGNNAITGTVTVEQTSQSTLGTSTFNGSGSTSLAITLQRITGSG